MKIIGEVEDNGCIDFGNWHIASEFGPDYYLHIEIGDAEWIQYYELREKLYAIEEKFQATWDEKFRRPWKPSQTFQQLVDACDRGVTDRDDA